MQIFTQTHSGRLASILAGLVLVFSGEFWIDDLSLVIAGALLLFIVLARPSTSVQP